MRITNKMRKRALSAIVEYLGRAKEATRNELIEGALSCYGLTSQDRSDLSPRSKYSVIRSYIGTALNDLINKKDIKQKGDIYTLAKEEYVIIKEDLIEEAIKTLLENGSYSKEDIFLQLEKEFGTDQTPTIKDDNTLRSLAGGVLFDLVELGEITIKGDKYTWANPNDEGDVTETPLPEEEFKPKFFKQLWKMGGRHFEGFVASLLEKYYTLSGIMVVYCDITGGSEDGGIDVALETVDHLGFVERIVAQTKCRDRAQINEKEVREFYGAMNAQNATRGIYVTTTSFHPSAELFIDSIGDLVGIDGDKLFDLVKRTGYGIKRCQQGYTFDTAIFIV